MQQRPSNKMRVSLGRKIFVYSLLSTLIVLLLSALAQFVYFRESAAKQQMDRSVQHAEFLYPSIARAAWNINADSMQVLLFTITTQPDLHAAEFRDSRLNVFEPAELRDQFDWSKCNRILTKDFSKERESGQELGEGFLRICAVDSEGLIDIGSYLKSLIPLAISIVAIAGVFIYLVGYSVLQPIRRLSKHISNGQPIESFVRDRHILFRGDDELDGLVDELKTRTRELRHERLFIDVSLPEVNDAIIQTSDTHLITRANRAAIKLLQLEDLTAGVFLDKHIPLKLLKPSNSAKPYRAKDMVWEISTVAVKSEEQSGFIHVIRDRTELTRLQEQSFYANKLTALGTLSGGIAHDYNNILAAIIGNAELLVTNERLPPEALKIAQSIVESSHRGASLSSQLLQFTKRRSFSISEFSCQDFMDDFITLVTPAIGRDKNLTYHCEPELYVRVDRGLLENALINLLLNARDAIKVHGKIEISVSKKVKDETQYVCFSVTDNGVGISSKHLSQVTDPYFTTKTRQKGTGLGLSMVSSFVQHHDGHLEVQSKPNLGTTVSIYLPFIQKTARTKPDKTEIVPHLEAPLKFSPRKILLIDDEVPLLRALTAILRHAGYEVEAASGHQQVIEQKLATKNFDLVICDVVLENSSILDIQNEFCLNDNLSPFFVITGHIPAEIEKEIRNDDFVGVLEKPFRSEELLIAISNYFEKGR